MVENSSDEKFNVFLNEHRLPEFFGSELGSEYTDVFRGIYRNNGYGVEPSFMLRYLITLVRCSMAEAVALVRMAAGKAVAGLDFSASDIEKDFLNDYLHSEDYELTLPKNLDKETLYKMRLATETELSANARQRTTGAYQRAVCKRGRF